MADIDPFSSAGSGRSRVAAPLFSPKERRTHRLFRVDNCLLVQRADTDDTTVHVADAGNT
jgi:hypothetical protein